jgi:hypothetical protein
MIVYGDPGYDDSAAGLLERVRIRAALARPDDPDDLRTLLIEAGQLEQALADRLDDGPSIRSAMAATDLAAEAFLGGAGTGPVRAALARLEPPAGLGVRVKIPEGFAFYTLYPEQYAWAARRWAEDHAAARPRAAVVVGIRSIGTGLSAVVARVLARAGWRVRRLTVRPAGHPYDRRVALPAETVRGAGFGLVVDEGPGRSGSSMAAAGRALAAAGLDRSAISFLPGHGAGPGTEGSAEVRRWWADTRLYVTGLDEPAWHGRSLPESLAELGGAAVARVEDLSGGEWRRAAYRDERDWPAALVPFGRTRYRVVRPDGTALLWTFEGLAGRAEAAFDRMERLAALGWTVAPCGCRQGFVAKPWTQGRRLERTEARPDLLARIGRYIAAAAGPPLTMAEQRAALERLRELLYWNIRESLGAAGAERSRRWAGLAPERPRSGYGDGRLGPEEWLLGDDGRLVKADGAGQDGDHTAVGRQPLAFALAGAMVEWRLDETTAEPLLKGYAQAGGEAVPAPALTFYRLAYAAFRLGQCAMSAGPADPAERVRLNRAEAFYRSQLAELLAR